MHDVLMQGTIIRVPGYNRFHYRIESWLPSYGPQWYEVTPLDNGGSAVGGKQAMLCTDAQILEHPGVEYTQ